MYYLLILYIDLSHLGLFARADVEWKIWEVVALDCEGLAGGFYFRFLVKKNGEK